MLQTIKKLLSLPLTGSGAVLRAACAVLLGLALAPLSTSADWQNYAPVSVSNGWNYDASSYTITNMGSFVLPVTVSNINYVKIYPADLGGFFVNTCPDVSISFYTADFATSSLYYYPNTNPYVNGYSASGTPFFRTAWYGSYATSKTTPASDGGCVYGLRTVAGVATTSQTITAGTYWYNVSNATAVQCDTGATGAKCLRVAGDAVGTNESQYYRASACGGVPCNDVQKKGTNGIGEMSIAFLTATSSMPAPEYESNVLPDVVICSTLDVGCYFSQALTWAFYPSEEAVGNVGGLLTFASTTFPFAYVYELPVFLSELFPSATSTFSIGIPWNVGGSTTTLVLLSTDKIQAVPYASTFRTLIGYAAWFMTVLTVYSLVMRIHNQNTHTV